MSPSAASSSESTGSAPINDEGAVGATLNPPLATPLQNGLVQGRCFLVTGGTQGLGLAVARHLLQAGAAGLVLVARSSPQGALAVKELRALATNTNTTTTTTTTQPQSQCQVEFLQADLSDAAQASSVIPRALELLEQKSISGVVNCAATTARGNLFTETADGFDQHMAVNVRAPFLITQAAAQHMKEQQRHGFGGSNCSIVNVISCAAYGGAPFIMAYSASKAALVALTKCHAAELAPHGIRVNGVNMGWCYTTNEDRIQSQLQGGNSRWWIAQADASVPLGRILRPDDAAVTIVFLLSSASSMTTGTVVQLHPEYAHGMLSLAALEEDAGR